MRAAPRAQSESQTDFTRLEPWRRRVLDSFERYNALQPRIPGEVMASIAEMDDLVQLINLMGSHIALKLEDRQTLLETQDVEEALSFLLRLLTEEIDILELENDIQDRVRSIVISFIAFVASIVNSVFSTTDRKSVV